MLTTRPKLAGLGSSNPSVFLTALSDSTTSQEIELLKCLIKRTTFWIVSARPGVSIRARLSKLQAASSTNINAYQLQLKNRTNKFYLCKSAISWRMMLLTRTLLNQTRLIPLSTSALFRNSHKNSRISRRESFSWLQTLSLAFLETQARLTWKNLKM